jgi:hypothetical protein
MMPSTMSSSTTVVLPSTPSSTATVVLPSSPSSSPTLRLILLPSLQAFYVPITIVLMACVGQLTLRN